MIAHSEIRKDFRERMHEFCCKNCNGAILCGNCKFYRAALAKSIKLDRADCVEYVAVECISGIIEEIEK